MTTLAVPIQPPRPSLTDRGPLYRWSVDQYHKLIERGILKSGMPYELLDGQLVLKNRSARGEDLMTVGRDHVWSVTALQELDAKLRRHGCYMRIQQPLIISDFDEPEPDGVIVPGDKDTYRDGHPGGRDTLCVIEVADSSLYDDRTYKLPLYANGGVAMCVIVNLPDQIIEIYREPMVGKGWYAAAETASGRKVVTFPTTRGKALSIAANRLLPPL